MHRKIPIINFLKTITILNTKTLVLFVFYTIFEVKGKIMNKNNTYFKVGLKSLKKCIGYSLIGILSLLWSQSLEAATRYGQQYCQKPGYTCITVKKGQSWKSLFPNDYDREVVQRLNRMSTNLYAGMRVAVPANLAQTNLIDLAPFPAKMEAKNYKVIIVDPQKLAFGAYDADGTLVHWGPISAGRDYCKDIHRRCHSPVGTFYIYAKQGAGCKSKKFPIGKGGAPMPYCMYFNGGYALHGSPEVPGYNASHGCIRMLPEDAKWLNTEFVSTGGSHGGTQVIVRPY